MSIHTLTYNFGPQGTVRFDMILRDGMVIYGNVSTSNLIYASNKMLMRLSLGEQIHEMNQNVLQ